jgi:hypothetical protein
VYIQQITKNMILFTKLLMLKWNIYYYDYRPTIAELRNLKGNEDDYN